MKLIFILITVFSLNHLRAQKTSSDIKELRYSHMDEDGKRISKDNYLSIVRDKSKNYSSWFFFAQDTSIVKKLVKADDYRKQISYPAFVKKLEELTGRLFPGNPLILLNYNYLNDICSHKIKINT